MVRAGSRKVAGVALANIYDLYFVFGILSFLKNLSDVFATATCIYIDLSPIGKQTNAPFVWT
jgi:hypothetical protein